MEVTPVPVSELVRAMASLPLLADASLDSVERLATRGVRREYRKGTYLFHQGDEAREVCFLVRRRIEISTTSVDGDRQLHTTFDHGQFFGELGPLGNGLRTTTAEAIEDAAVWVPVSKGGRTLPASREGAVRTSAGSSPTSPVPGSWVERAGPCRCSTSGGSLASPACRLIATGRSGGQPRGARPAPHR